jgi:hypothetical protein
VQKEIEAMLAADIIYPIDKSRMGKSYGRAKKGMTQKS